MTSLASYAHLRSRLYLALALNAAIIVAEFIGGWILDSIGLMSDAGHNFVDQGALFFALYAHILTARPATEAKIGRAHV
jgi:cobalt-zinc-cadmium efflux system protein